MSRFPQLLVVSVLAAGLVHGLPLPLAAQGGPNSVPLPNPNLQNLPPAAPLGITLPGGITISPGVSPTDAAAQDNESPAGSQDASPLSDTTDPLPGTGGGTDNSGTTITIPLN